MRIHFVINPKAGRVRYGRLAAAIRREFDGYDTHITPRLAVPPAATDMVVAVGGDGTVNRVVNAVAPRGVPIGILPRGSSNDLAAALGIPGDFHSACEIVKAARITEIDLVSVNGKYFAICGGLGLAAAIAQRANRWKEGPDRMAGAVKVLGRKVYLLAAIFELCGRWRPVRARVLCEGRMREALWTSLLICNQPHSGGFCPSPLASNRDGLLDLCEIQAPPQRARILWISLQVLRGRADNCPEVSQHRTTAVTIVSPKPMPFLGDGEILDFSRQFRIKVHPRVLRVAVPDNKKAMEGETC